MEQIQIFHDAITNPGLYARGWKEKTGKLVIGTFCSYAPEEIIYAADALGYRVFGSSSEIAKADAHLQAYSCSLVRGALEDSLSGNLEFLDGVIFPHTCDSIQRLSDIWRINKQSGFHLDAVMPVKLNTESAKIYMADIIKKFRRDLEEKTGSSITDENLKNAIVTFNEIRRLLKDIYHFRMLHPEKIEGKDIHAIVKAGMVMDRNEYLSHLKEVLDALEVTSAPDTSTNKRIVLSGGLCNMPDVYPVIEQAGAKVVMDDLCTGSRFFDGKLEVDIDPIEAIANRYSNRGVCPAKHSGTRDRGENLVKICQEANAEGVIFIYLKFCDPHGFDYPYLKEMLEDKNIPCMLYEMEDQVLGDGQFQTRCEAFIEML